MATFKELMAYAEYLRSKHLPEDRTPMTAEYAGYILAKYDPECDEECDDD